MDNSPKKISIVIPTLNEEMTISSILKQLINHKFNTILLENIYVVDDDSSDSTRDLASEHDNKSIHVSVLHRRSNKGYGASSIEGILTAIEEGNKFIVTMDVDGSHDVEEIEKLVLASEDKDTIVVGSRYVRNSKISGWPISRRVMSKFANVLGTLILGIKLRDKTNGFRVYNADVKAFLKSREFPAGYDFLLTSAYFWEKSGGVFVEIPIHFRNREVGSSNLRLKQIIEWFRQLLILRRI